LDVHRDFCEVAIADGGRARPAGRVQTTPGQLELFAQSLAPDDRVVMEATGNALAIARILEPRVAAVVLAHAKQVRAIAHAKVKTDKVDARMLADLLAAGLIPRCGSVTSARGCCAGWSRVAGDWSSGGRRSRTRSRRS
jgi:transposase